MSVNYEMQIRVWGCSIVNMFTTKYFHC